MKNFLSFIILTITTAVLTGCSLSTLSNNTDGKSEIIKVSHNGVQFVPSTIQLTKGKKYTIETTPTSDGKGCMTEVVIPGKGPHTIKNGETFSIEVDATEAKTIPLVCASMGMKQGEIVIE